MHLESLGGFPSEQQASVSEMHQDVSHNLPQVHAADHLLISQKSERSPQSDYRCSTSMGRLIQSPGNCTAVTSVSQGWWTIHLQRHRTVCRSHLVHRRLQTPPTPCSHTYGLRCHPPGRYSVPPPCSRRWSLCLRKLETH